MVGTIMAVGGYLLLVFLAFLFGGAFVAGEYAPDAERFRALMDKAVEAAKGKMTQDDFRKAWDAMKYETEADGSVSYSLRHPFDSRPPSERN